MKLSKEQIDILNESKKIRDWEVFHSDFDDIMKKHLRKIDPEFMEDLEKQSEGTVFWYA